MKIIGICGSSGSGKSTVCDYFDELGVPILDCDRIYHDLVDAPSDCLTEIVSEFGQELLKDGRLDRKKLGKIVFSDPMKLSRLNEISHRHVKLKLEQEFEKMSNEGFPACVIDAPMLFEAELDKRCDAVIAVVADEAAQIQRICVRDGIDVQNATKRLANQISATELMERADFVIKNHGTLEDLKNNSQKILNIILNQEENDDE